MSHKNRSKTCPDCGCPRNAETCYVYSWGSLYARCKACTNKIRLDKIKIAVSEDIERVRADRNRRAQAYRDRHRARYLLNGVRARCKQRGIPFDLDESDIAMPPVCPALGIPLTRGHGRLKDDSASLDRLDPSKGYVKGNVVVISMLANKIKTNATADQIRRVADWLSSVLEKKQEQP